MALVTIPIFIGGNGAASSNGPVASGVTMTFDAVTAHIDQMGVAAGSGGGVIRKAHLEVMGVSNSGATTTDWTLSLAVNGGAAGTYAKTGQAIGGTGGYYSFRVDGDFTAWLAANWPAATASCSIVATVTMTGAPIINCTAILWVTVEFTPASCPVQTKWVPVLIGSHDGATVSTGFTTIGTVPALTGMGAGTFRLAEAGVTIRQKKLEVTGDTGGLFNAGNIGTPIVRVGGAGGTSYTFASEATAAAANSRFERFLVDAPDTVASGLVEMRTTDGNVSYPFIYSGIQTIAHYVYSFTVAGTTHCTVGAYQHVGQAFGSPGYGVETDALQFRTKVQVPEASIDAQGPMGWRVNIGDSDHFAINLRGYQLAGPADDATVLQTKTSQRYERVRHNDSGDNAEFAHRVDGGAGAGGAHALAPGFNYFKLHAWASDTTAIVGAETDRRGIQVSACFHYAYVAPVPAAGPHAVTHVIECSLFPMYYSATPSGEARFAYSAKATATERDVPPVPTAGAYFQALGLRLYQVQNTTAINVGFDGRQAGFPYVNLYSGHPYGGYATIWTRTWLELTRYYKQYPAQPVEPGAGWSPPADLDCTLVCGNSSRCAWTWSAAYHEQVRTITVTVSGYTGDGSGIPVKVFDNVTGELVAMLTTAIGGSASFEWPDAVDALYASATQGTAAGSSLPSTASTLAIEFAGANKGVGGKFNQGFN